MTIVLWLSQIGNVKTKISLQKMVAVEVCFEIEVINSFMEDIIRTLIVLRWFKKVLSKFC